MVIAHGHSWARGGDTVDKIAKDLWAKRPLGRAGLQKPVNFNFVFLNPSTSNSFAPNAGPPAAAPPIALLPPPRSAPPLAEDICPNLEHDFAVEATVKLDEWPGPDYQGAPALAPARRARTCTERGGTRRNAEGRGQTSDLGARTGGWTDLTVKRKVVGLAVVGCGGRGFPSTEEDSPCSHAEARAKMKRTGTCEITHFCKDSPCNSHGYLEFTPCL